MRYLILSLLLCSCAFDPVITRRAGIRRVAGGRLDSCLQSPPGRPWNEAACKAESAEYCQSQGLEKTCGIDEAFWLITDRNMQNRTRR